MLAVCTGQKLVCSTSSICSQFAILSPFQFYLFARPMCFVSRLAYCSHMVLFIACVAWWIKYVQVAVITYRTKYVQVAVIIYRAKYVQVAVITYRETYVQVAVITYRAIDGLGFVIFVQSLCLISVQLLIAPSRGVSNALGIL